MRWFVRGDVDGFFGLALDNLVQLLVIVGLCGSPLLQFPDAIIYDRILPGAAVSLLVGNLFYAWQARRLARRTGRETVTALPYGINTPTVFLFIFLVMVPARHAALGAGLDADAAARVAWRAGLLACLCSGVIEAIGALAAGWIRRWTPRAAMLSALAGVAIGFVSMPFLFQAYATPLVALLPLGVVLVTYFGRMRFVGGVPGGFVALVLGAAMAWLVGFHPQSGPTSFGLHLPVPVLGDILRSLDLQLAAGFLPVVLSMGLVNVVGSLQNIESAEAAGDSFPTAPSLAVNGLGSIAAACFGSCFPTTIYIGHPGWKAMGARHGYSVLNAAFCTAICLTGTIGAIAWLVPIEAALAIVVWIALIITAQAFQATEARHAPAVVLGILPGIAAWGVSLLKTGLRVGLPAGSRWDETEEVIMTGLRQNSVFPEGAFALEQGALFASMILAAATVHILDRRFRRAAVWFAIAAAVSACGLMHSHAFAANDVILDLVPGWKWAVAYAVMAGIMLLVPHFARPVDGEG